MARLGRLSVLVLLLPFTLMVIVGLRACISYTTSPRRASFYHPSTLAPARLPDGREFRLTADEFPAMDGSTSTIPLTVVVGCKIMGLGYRSSLGGQRIFFANSTVESALEHSKASSRLAHHGTHEAYVNLIDGKADLILVARLPSEDERDLPQQRLVAFDARPIALDAFVFLVNPQNPVTTLTLDQIRGIYSGQITHWKQVGGADVPIQAYQRDRNSGSQEIMKKLVMKDVAMARALPRMILGTMGGPIEQTTQDAAAISYSLLFYVSVMTGAYGSGGYRLLAIDGVEPSDRTIRDGTYPLASQVFAVVRQDTDPASNTIRVRDWLLSEDGTQAVAHSGYVPLTPVSATAPAGEQAH